MYTRKTAPSVLSWVAPGSRVLEFGPAYGYMTRYLKEELDCRVVGIEFNPDMASHAGRFAERMIVADIERDPWEGQVEGPFDYLLFADVLEHLRQPVRVLQKALRFGSCVLTSIPNIGYSAVLLGLLDGDFTYRELGIMDNTHLQFFTRSSLGEMMSACGLTCRDGRDLVLPQPSCTEMRKYYLEHPWAMWSIIRAPDSDVYQFINKWEKRPESPGVADPPPAPRRSSAWEAVKIAARDARYYVADHYPRLRTAWRKVKPACGPGAT